MPSDRHSYEGSHRSGRSSGSNNPHHYSAGSNQSDRTYPPNPPLPSHPSSGLPPTHYFEEFHHSSVYDSRQRTDHHRASEHSRQQIQGQEHNTRGNKHPVSPESAEYSVTNIRDFAYDPRDNLHNIHPNHRSNPRLPPVIPGRVFEDTQFSEEPDEMDMNMEEPLETTQQPYPDGRESTRMPSASDYTSRGPTAGYGGIPRGERKRSSGRDRSVSQRRHPVDQYPVHGIDVLLAMEDVHGRSQTGRHRGRK